MGATNWSDQRASYSNFGSKVELSAPGGDASAAQPYSFILSSWSDAPPCATNSNNCYVWTAGTSMAAPQVAGLAAVLFASGITDANDVLARLDQTADDLGAPGRDPEFGFGRINAYRALTRTDPSAPPIAHIDPVAAGVEGSPLSFSSLGSRDPNNHPITYRWDFGDGSTSTDANPVHTYADNGLYHVTLTVTDESNRATTATADVTIANLPPVVTASLTASSILSGQSVTLHGTFSDAGVADAPWQWGIAWGQGGDVSAGSVTSQSAPIDAPHRFCAAGGYSVRLSVTDKDGGVGGAEQPITVTRNAVRIAPPRDFEDLLEGRGRLPVVIFGTPTFDVRTIDPTTATIGDGEGDETSVARRRDGSFFTSIEDDNRDGQPDLILYFERNLIADLLNVPSNRGIRRPPPLPPSITIVLRATLADACTQVEGSWTLRLKRS